MHWEPPAANHPARLRLLEPDGCASADATPCDSSRLPTTPASATSTSLRCTATAKPRAVSASSCSATADRSQSPQNTASLPPKQSLADQRRPHASLGPVVKQLPGLKQRLARVANAATRNREAPHLHCRRRPKPPSTAASLPSAPTTSTSGSSTKSPRTTSGRRPPPPPRRPGSQQGTIGTFGVGSSADKIPALLAERPAYCRTLQYEWSVLDARYRLCRTPSASTTAPSPITSARSTPRSLNNEPALPTLVRIDRHRPQQPGSPRPPHAQGRARDESRQHCPLLLQRSRAHPRQRPYRRRQQSRTPLASSTTSCKRNATLLAPR